MAEIKLIRKDDFQNLVCHKLDWDIEVKGISYQVVRIDGYVHTIGGHLDWGNGNNFWAYPLHEEMKYENLVEFDGEPGATWGIEYSPVNCIKTKWGETEIMRGRNLIITRNGKPFYDGFITFHQAIAYVKDGLISEHPMNLNERGYDRKCIGRKVWWRSEPAVIKSYINGQACVILEPDGIEHFTTPPEYENDFYDENDSVKADIFDEHIWWFMD